MLFACAGAVVASGEPISITAARNPVLTSLIIILMPLHPAPNWYSVSSLKGLWIIFRQGNERLDRHSAHAIVRSHVRNRSEEHTSELQSLMRISYAVFCLKKKKTDN